MKQSSSEEKLLSNFFFGTRSFKRNRILANGNQGAFLEDQTLAKCMATGKSRFSAKSFKAF